MFSFDESNILKMDPDCLVKVKFLNEDTVTLILDTIDLTNHYLTGDTTLGDTMLIYFKNIKSLEQLKCKKNTNVEINISADLPDFFRHVNQNGKAFYNDLKQSLGLEDVTTEELNNIMNLLLIRTSQKFQQITNQLDEVGETIKDSIKPYASTLKKSILNFYNNTIQDDSTNNDFVQFFNLQDLIKKLFKDEDKESIFGFKSNEMPDDLTDDFTDSCSNRAPKDMHKDHNDYSNQKEPNSTFDLNQVFNMLFSTDESKHNEEPKKRYEPNEDDTPTSDTNEQYSALADMYNVFMNNNETTPSKEEDEMVETSSNSESPKNETDDPEQEDKKFSKPNKKHSFDQNERINSILKKFTQVNTTTTESTDSKEQQDADSLATESNHPKMFVNDLVNSVLKQYIPDGHTKQDETVEPKNKNQNED
ncbi:hypothetical protein [Haloplasma contractile]|uniref:Uncharacterized protein n=1 Tax=Haloplasma contractile SSD-17B TaxID=1033810 RepID=F7PTR4_9MOLU|nr:hypothetical protein [Haloplasma contractile]ERJ12227.1 hypothetical protein HLPCO_001754 [Haloplasma contractile SSD-17B]